MKMFQGVPKNLVVCYKDFWFYKALPLESQDGRVKVGYLGFPLSDAEWIDLDSDRLHEFDPESFKLDSDLAYYQAGRRPKGPLTFKKKLPPADALDIMPFPDESQGQATPQTGPQDCDMVPSIDPAPEIRQSADLPADPVPAPKKSAPAPEIPAEAAPANGAADALEAGVDATAAAPAVGPELQKPSANLAIASESAPGPDLSAVASPDATFDATAVLMGLATSAAAVEALPTIKRPQQQQPFPRDPRLQQQHQQQYQQPPQPPAAEHNQNLLQALLQRSMTHQTGAGGQNPGSYVGGTAGGSSKRKAKNPQSTIDGGFPAEAHPAAAAATQGGRSRRARPPPGFHAKLVEMGTLDDGAPRKKVTFAELEDAERAAEGMRRGDGGEEDEWRAEGSLDEEDSESESDVEEEEEVEKAVKRRRRTTTTGSNAAREGSHSQPTQRGRTPSNVVSKAAAAEDDINIKMLLEREKRRKAVLEWELESERLKWEASNRYAGGLMGLIQNSGVAGGGPQQGGGVLAALAARYSQQNYGNPRQQQQLQQMAAYGGGLATAPLPPAQPSMPPSYRSSSFPPPHSSMGGGYYPPPQQHHHQQYPPPPAAPPQSWGSARPPAGRPSFADLLHQQQQQRQPPPGYGGMLQQQRQQLPPPPMHPHYPSFLGAGAGGAGGPPPHMDQQQQRYGMPPPHLQQFAGPPPPQARPAAPPAGLYPPYATHSYGGAVPPQHMQQQQQQPGGSSSVQALAEGLNALKRSANADRNVDALAANFMAEIAAAQRAGKAVTIPPDMCDDRGELSIEKVKLALSKFSAPPQAAVRSPPRTVAPTSSHFNTGMGMGTSSPPHSARSPAARGAGSSGGPLPMGGLSSRPPPPSFPPAPSTLHAPGGAGTAAVSSTGGGGGDASVMAGLAVEAQHLLQARTEGGGASMMDAVRALQGAGGGGGGGENAEGGGGGGGPGGLHMSTEVPEDLLRAIAGRYGLQGDQQLGH